MKPLVSSVIPAYNRPQGTERAIRSVLEQTYSNIELLVVDDGSDPHIRDTVDLHWDMLDWVTIHRHDRNRGANAARTTGIENAAGKYVAFLDSDDEWHPTKVQRQVEQLESTQYGASYTAIEQVDQRGRVNAVSPAIESGDISESLFRHNVVGSFSAVMVRANDIERVGPPDPDLPCWQDWEWYLRLSEHVDFGAINEPLTVRHNEGDQISSLFEPKRDVAFPVIQDRVRAMAPSDREAAIAEAYVTHHLGYAALTNHRFSTALRLMTKAIQLHPWEPMFYKYLACAGPHYELLRFVKRWLIRLRRKAATRR